jgi:hypothetical protein
MASFQTVFLFLNAFATRSSKNLPISFFMSVRMYQVREELNILGGAGNIGEAH